MEGLYSWLPAPGEPFFGTDRSPGWTWQGAPVMWLLPVHRDDKRIAALPIWSRFRFGRTRKVRG